jgi:hypothetical protein
MPVRGLELTPGSERTAVRFHSESPEEVIAALSVRGRRLTDLEVIGVDLEEAVQNIVHQASRRHDDGPGAGPGLEHEHEHEHGDDREAVVAHSADTTDPADGTEAAR